MPLTSEDIYRQYLEQQQAANKWNSSQNLINLATLGLSGFAGLANSRQQDQQNQYSNQLLEDQTNYSRAQDSYNRKLAAQNAIVAAILGQQGDQRQGAVDFADRAPLGAEQLFTQKMARTRGLSQAAENFHPSAPTDAGILDNYNPGPNILSAFTTPDYRASISPEATSRSIAERRKALAGINPDFQFGSMSDYGLPSRDAEVSQYSQGVGNQRRDSNAQLMALLNQQLDQASQPIYNPAPTAPAQAPEPEKKKGGFWKTLGKIGLMAAPIVAAPFTGGASLAAIGALSGAGAGALDGGWKGAALGGALGGITAGIGGGAAGAAAKQGMGESAGSAIQRAILNPRALATLGGAAPGAIGAVSRGVSPLLPGARPANAITPGFEGPNLPIVGGPSAMMPDVPSFPPIQHGWEGQMPIVPGSIDTAMPQGMGGSGSLRLGGLGSQGPQGPASASSPVRTSGSVRMIAPDGHTAIANVLDVQKMIKLGWRVAPQGTGQQQAPPAQSPFPQGGAMYSNPYLRNFGGAQ